MGPSEFIATILSANCINVEFTGVITLPSNLNVFSPSISTALNGLFVRDNLAIINVPIFSQLLFGRYPINNCQYANYVQLIVSQYLRTNDEIIPTLLFSMYKSFGWSSAASSTFPRSVLLNRAHLSSPPNSAEHKTLKTKMSE